MGTKEKRGHFQDWFCTKETTNRNISTTLIKEKHEDKEEGFTLIEVLAAMFISTMIFGGILYFYQFNFSAVNYSLNENHARNTMQQVDTFISQSILDYGVEPELSDDELIVHFKHTDLNTELLYDEAENKFILVSDEGNKELSYVYPVDDIPIFSLTESSLHLQFTFNNGLTERSFLKNYPLITSRYDMEYFEDEENIFD